MPTNTDPPSAPAAAAEQRQAATNKPKRLFDQHVFRDWCKACGICMALCPTQIITRDEEGKAVITDADKCIGCRTCEVHCPDFAITITERHPRRRKTDGVP